LRKKNIIIVDVDALMPSRTGVGGNLSCVSPFLDSLASKGLNFSNAFTMGNPTEFALPGLFASSYLLDNGGYRNGIADREVAFAEVLKRIGYSTSAFFTIFRPKNDEYHRGFDDFYHLYDLQVTEKNFMNTANWYVDALGRGSIETAECKSELSIYYKEYLEDVQRYCESWIDYGENGILPESRIFNNINYRMVSERVKMNLESLAANPDKVIEPILTGGRIGLSEIVNKEVCRRKKVLKPTFLDLKFRAQVLRYCGAMFNRSTSRDSGKNTFALALDRILHGQSNLLLRYPSGGYILEAFKRWHGKHKEGKPFYSYIKLLDAHELNLYSHDLNQQKDEQKQEYEIFKKCLRDLCSEKNYKGNLLYDCSIRYVDHVLHRLVDYLKKANILKDTILVITADHGGTYPNIPVRGNKSHRVNAFYDELYRIPLVFSGEGLEAKCSKSLVSSVDIGSTLLDLIGESNPASFRGRSLLSDVERHYVMSENQGRGPCDLIRKSVRVCIRSKKIKLVYEKPPGKSEEGFVDQLYDLRNDPDEMVNLKSDVEALSDSEDLLKVARARTEEIVS